MACRASVMWDERYLGYDFGDHPMHPVRLDLTIRLARELGVLDRVTLRQPEPADEATLLTAHTARATWPRCARRPSIPVSSGTVSARPTTRCSRGMYEMRAR